MDVSELEGLSDKELKLRLRLAQIEKNERCQNNFLEFVKVVWPQFITGRHHRIIAEKLERVASGELKRLIINCLLYTSPSPRDGLLSRMPSSA